MQGHYGCENIPLAWVMSMVLIRHAVQVIRTDMILGRSGVNYRAVLALVLGIIVALLGLVWPPLRWLYDYSWFVGFLVSGTVYVILMQRAPAGARDLIGEET